MKQRWMIWLIVASLLSSCVAAVVAGAATGLVVYDRRSMVMIERDARIFHLIHTAIVTNPQFYHAHVVVTVFNQSVLLVGQTPDVSLRLKAADIAQHTLHVRHVYNEITIDPTPQLQEQGQDVWITSQIRAQLLTRKGLESGSVRVVTERGVVYLMGILTLEQANLAVDVARSVYGVRRVVKVFQYIQ